MNFKKLIKGITISLALVLISSCSGADGYCNISFNTNTTYKTNSVLSQNVKYGGKVKKPSVSITEDNPDNLKVYAWYTDKQLTDEWNFKKDKVEKNMILYAEWKKTFTVNYYVGKNTTPENTITVFDGETIKEHVDYAIGYEYLGSYTDREYTQKFDYSQGVTSNLDIYMKISEGIDIYEGNPAGGLYSNLEIFSASDKKDTEEKPEIGSIQKAADGEAVLIDFGYSPDYTDPYVEVSLQLDISKSRILHFVMKHYGLGDKITLYFTTLLDVETYKYSATGANYSENFVYRHSFKQNEIGMTEEDDYVDIAIDLAANSYFNGYSVWGTSPYLGKLRIQLDYQSQSYEDRSNTMLLKRIYGSNTGYEKGIVTEDSEKIKTMLVDDEQLPIQQDVPNAFIFPKDYEYVDTSVTSSVYKKKEGLLMHYENEIVMREHSDKTQRISLVCPTDEQGEVIGDKIISLDANRTLKVTLRNLGYAESINIVITNDYGGKTYAPLRINRQMNKSKTYVINLNREALMIHTLVSVDFEYEAVGVDNALLLESVRFVETQPTDIPGLNFDDSKAFGFVEKDNKATITYSPSYAGVEFDVNDKSAVVTSSKTDINTSNLGYYFLQLTYSKSKSSRIVGVYITLFVDGSYREKMYFETPSIAKNSTTCELDTAQGGTVTNLKIEFKFEDGTTEIGTNEGIIRLCSLKFVTSDIYCFDMAKDYSSGLDSTWRKNFEYSYDDNKTASQLIPDYNATSWNISFYLGYCHAHYSTELYACQNLPTEGKTKLVIIYNNPDEASWLNLIAAYSSTISGNPDLEESYTVAEYKMNLKGNMKEYEWAAAVFTLPQGEKYAGKFIGKFSLFNNAASVYIRNVAVI